METNTQTLEFDLLNTLALMNEEVSLSGLLKGKTDLTLPTLITTAKKGLISEDLNKYIEDIFNKIIINREQYLDRYRYLSTKEVVAEAKPKPNKQPKEDEKEFKLPRRYGKDDIVDDIKDQGGKPTELQTAMLCLNDIKNLTIRLQNRGISDIFTDKGVIIGDKKLSSKDCRNIISTTETILKKLKPIVGK
jgi:hypothetical protein